MRPYRESALTRMALIAFFILIVGYAYYEARGILFGPTIQVPQAIEQVSVPYISLTGTTSHISALSVNGQSVPVTEAGVFDVPFALSPGFNRIVLDATDKYGHSTEKILQVVYIAPTSTLPAYTTTTPATSTTSASGASSSPKTATSTH